ncbi:flagellar hook-length control protein FliK [Paracoccus sp. T5]|uniref:flagellar hook-length control protein FliK n=1 Tax=Paracoccus sp. T5 TaxID=3402161 RepID=UPI003AE6A82F
MTDLLPISTPPARPEAMLWQPTAASGEEADFLAILPTADLGQAWPLGTMLLPEGGLAPEAGEADASALDTDPLTFWLEASLGLSAGFQPPPQPLPRGLALPDLPVAVASQPAAAQGMAQLPALPEGAAGPDDSVALESAMVDAVPQSAPPFQPEAQEVGLPASQADHEPAAMPEAAKRAVADAAAVPALNRGPVPAAVPAVEGEAGTQPAAEGPADSGSMERAAPAEATVRRPDAPSRALPEGLASLPDPTATEPRLQREMGAPERVASAAAGPAGPAEARPVLNQVTQAWVSATGDRTDIALSPEELGRLRLVFSGHDRSQVTIWAERPETLDLVRRNADLLTQQLAEAGVPAGSLEFRQGTQRDWPQPARSMGRAEGGPDPLPGPALRPAPAPLSDRRLDIRL